MSDDSQPLARMLKKLRSRAPLGEDSAAAVLSLPVNVRDVEPGAYLVRDGDRPTHCSFILSGFAFRQKLTGDGARQICSVHLPGDIIDLPSLFLRKSDHNVQMLTHGRVAFIPRWKSWRWKILPSDGRCGSTR